MIDIEVVGWLLLGLIALFSFFVILTALGFFVVRRIRDNAAEMKRHR